jgi:large subunit ribosomal protein L24
MATAKIQTGDKVKVITGKYKNTIGQVLKVEKTQTSKGLRIRASVSGVPQIIKFRKAFTYNGESFPGSQYMVDRLIDISNLRIVTTDGQTTGVRVELRNGKKVRVMKKTGEVVVNKKVPKIKNNSENQIQKVED